MVHQDAEDVLINERRMQISGRAFDLVGPSSMTGGIPGGGNELWMMMLLLLLAAARLQAASGEQAPPITIDTRCLADCGNVRIPYPFGTGPGCFLPGFQVICSHAFSPPRLFLGDSLDDDDVVVQSFTIGNYSVVDEDHESNFSDQMEVMRPMEVMDISVSRAQVRLYAAVSSDCGCGTREPHHCFTRRTTFLPEHFLISGSQNVLIGVGLNIEAVLSTSSGNAYGGLITRCISGIAAKDGPCSGQGCCEASFTDGFHQVSAIADAKRTEWLSNRSGNTTCSFAMLVEKGWYNYSSEDVYGDETYFSKKFPRGLPQVVDFTIGNSSCPAQGQPPPQGQGYACLSGNSSCVDASNGTGYVCKCWEHYDGNPYIPGAGGCQDIDECQLRELYSHLQNQYPCSSGGICKNRVGGYDCPCKPGMKGDGKAGTCTEKFPVPAKMAVGIVGGISTIVVLVLFVLFLSERKRMRELFIRNGGPMLEKINNIKIFKDDELKQITKNYSHILGSGAFGVVYMGFLDDKQRIAVKKSKNTNKAQIDQFTNEVIIQSRVIHKNIVKLVGCCLEVDVPILVYEFVPNGSLEDVLHDKNRVPLTINQRLAIAAESAEGLAYMHAKTSTNIQHGDVKPANILLDDDFMPKISDFGISRLIARGNDQHSEEVIGDNNYMDPVYRETGLLTNKSDVYSFGLVLYELITGNKALGGDNCGYTIYHLGTYTKEKKANVTSGIQLGEDENFELLQSQLREGKDFEVLRSLAEIARECLHRNVDQRPEMTDIAERLQNIRKRYARKSPSP